VNVDYSQGYEATDWVSSANQRTPDGETSESVLGAKGISKPGKITEGRSYLRWEEPVLGINGEGRVTPLMPGCQVVYTVKSRDGKNVVHNTIVRSRDEAVEISQKLVPFAIDMAPVQPHSAQRKARSCESCHNNPKAMGYGIGGGVFNASYSQPIIEDLIDSRTGKPIPKNTQIQIQSIPDLDFDWSTIVNAEGDQVQTVGTHWPLSRALNADEREGMTRTGLCMGCHREMTSAELWNLVSTTGILNDQEHIDLMNKMLKAYARSGEPDLRR
jgi:hypothetical protein